MNIIATRMDPDDPEEWIILLEALHLSEMHISATRFRNRLGRSVPQGHCSESEFIILSGKPAKNA